MLVALAMLVAGCGSDENGSGPSGAQSTEAGTARGSSQSESEAQREREEEEAKGAAGKSCDEVGDLGGTRRRRSPPTCRCPGTPTCTSPRARSGRRSATSRSSTASPIRCPRRDDARDVLVENGYKLLSKDEEAGAEAESHLSGKHSVDIQVINLCEGKLRVRYTVS